MQIILMNGVTCRRGMLLLVVDAAMLSRRRAAASSPPPLCMVVQFFGCVQLSYDRTVSEVAKKSVPYHLPHHLAPA